TFVDPRLPARIDILKTDDADPAAPLAGATFQLYGDAALQHPVAGKSCETAAGGTCSITDILPPGTYYVHEQVVPAGYEAAPDQKVTLGLDTTVSLTFVDQRKPATINIVKKDDAGAALAGATFGLHSHHSCELGDAVEGKSCTTAAAGTCTITDILPPGAYWLHETGVPAGYQAAPDQQVTLALNEDVVLPDFVDKRIPATVNIVKQDDSGAALAGAGFGLYSDHNGAIGLAMAGATFSAGASGLCSIGGILPPGTYWLHETTVPKGYEAAPDQKVTLGLADTVTLTFVDRRLVPAINV